MRALLLVAVVSTSAEAAPASRCIVDPQPPAPAAPAKAPPCFTGTAATQATVRDKVTKGYAPVHDGGKPAIAFACDGLGATIREIVVELGSGHGGSLSMWRARRNAAGTYDVRAIVYQGAAIGEAAQTPPFRIATGTAAVPELDLVRTVMGTTVHEVAPPTSTGLHDNWSSNDFHTLVRLVDDAGRTVEREYTGYTSSSGQDTYLPLEAATTALAPITSVAHGTSVIVADDRALFDDLFAAALPHLDDEFHWWVMERYVDLSRYLGTRRSIPTLLTRLTLPAKPSRANTDARVNAVDALAKISGWDARTGATVDAAAAAYLAECKVKP